MKRRIPRACLNFAAEGIFGSEPALFAHGDGGSGGPLASEQGVKSAGSETKIPRLANSKQALNSFGERTRKIVRQALSPTFLMILTGAALMWYTSKLSHTYDTEMDLNLRVDGQRYRITAFVNGRGSAILAHQLSLKKPLSFTLDELSTRRSRKTVGAIIIAPASLQKAINDRNDDLLVVEVTDAPEFMPATSTEKQEAGE